MPARCNMVSRSQHLCVLHPSLYSNTSVESFLSVPRAIYLSSVLFNEPLIWPDPSFHVQLESCRWQRSGVALAAENVQRVQPSVRAHTAQQLAQSVAGFCARSPCEHPPFRTTGQLAIGLGAGPGGGGGGPWGGLPGEPWKEPVQGPPVMFPLLPLRLNSTFTPVLNSRRQV